MARKFNGTADGYRTSKFTMKGWSTWTISMMLYWDAYANDDDLALEYNVSSAVAGFYIDPNQNAGLFAFSWSSGSSDRVVRYNRPSIAGKWSRIAVSIDTNTDTIYFYADGAQPTFNSYAGSGVTTVTLGDADLHIMCRNLASLFSAGRMANLAIWGGTLPRMDLQNLSNGVVLPLEIKSNKLLGYWPLNDPAQEWLVSTGIPAPIDVPDPVRFNSDPPISLRPGAVTRAAQIITSTQLHAYKGTSSFSANASNFYNVGFPSALQINGPFTLSTWIYFKSTAIQQLFLSKWTGGVTNDCYLLQYNGAGAFSFFTSTGAAQQGVTSITAPSVGRWYHVCGVRSTAGSTNLSIYINGILEATAASGAMTSANVDLLISRYGGGTGLPLDGYLAHCALWNDALTTDEIARLGNGYSLPLDIRFPNLRGYWPLGGLGGRDYSIYGNDGVLNGSIPLTSSQPELQNSKNLYVGGQSLIAPVMYQSSGVPGVLV